MCASLRHRHDQCMPPSECRPHQGTSVESAPIGIERRQSGLSPTLTCATIQAGLLTLNYTVLQSSARGEDGNRPALVPGLFPFAGASDAQQRVCISSDLVAHVIVAAGRRSCICLLRRARAPHRCQRHKLTPALLQPFILIGAPTAFHPECPPVMYLASKPASRSAMAVRHPTWKP